LKASTAIGIVVAIVACLLTAVMEGTNPVALLNIPAMIVIVGGTAGATIASTGLKDFLAVPKLLILAMKGREFDYAANIKMLVGLAEKARREGLLALESEVQSIDDAYTKKGLQLVVDGTDSDLVRGILQSEIDGISQRHGHFAHMFAQGAGYAPTIGILGTVMGLINVMANLANPDELGPLIAGAFIATLYGVGSANIIFMPVSSKLKALSQQEIGLNLMLLEGVLSIQAGDNPRVLQEKLETYVSPAERARLRAADAGAAAEQKQAA
jgi:chemotaxis protein MotA